MPENQDLTPGGMPAASPYLRFSHGKGARCWDVEGHEYIDLVCGQGPIVLGHGHPAVVAAVAEQLARGNMLPGPGRAHEMLKAALERLYPHTGAIVTFKTGSEAVAAAVRLARARTGRHLILRLGFHGWHDEMISPYVSCHTYDPAGFTSEYPRGIRHASYRDTVAILLTCEPDEIIAAVADAGERLAAVLVDPVQLGPDVAEVARGIIEAAHRVGALTIFDELKTGFRVDLGGVQARYNFRADLTVLSKAIANGLPLGVVLGDPEVIALGREARIKGTYGGETSAIAAALATIDVLESQDGPRTLAIRGAQLLEGLHGAISAVGLGDLVRAVPYHWPCMPYVHFGPDGEHLRRPFYYGLARRGVLMLPAHMSFVSLALQESDVDQVVDTAELVLREITTRRIK